MMDFIADLYLDPWGTLVSGLLDSGELVTEHLIPYRYGYTSWAKAISIVLGVVVLPVLLIGETVYDVVGKIMEGLNRLSLGLVPTPYHLFPRSYYDTAQTVYTVSTFGGVAGAFILGLGVSLPIGLGLIGFTLLAAIVAHYAWD
jgi:hypothetical protein